MNCTNLPRALWLPAVLSLFCGALHGVDVSGEYEDPGAALGKAASYRLTGDCKFGWKSGVVSGDMDLNGHSFFLETGGGNHTVLRGALQGAGSVAWRGGGVPQVAPSVLTGDRPNTFQGVFTLVRGVLDLDKPPGMDAVPGDLIVGVEGSASVRLQKSDQINDNAVVTLGGQGISSLELQGRNERIAGLILGAHAEISMGGGPATLLIGDCSARAWDLTKTLTIRDFKPGRDRLVFGGNARGLVGEQLARIGFASPAGRAAGLYTARIGPDGGVEPGELVHARNPPFDLSAEAVAARAKLYEVQGVTRLVGAGSPLREGMTISFFGDSLTWQNGFIGTMGKALQSAEATRLKSVKLMNRGINGGGVLQVRDGVAEGAFPGRSAQKSFAEVLAGDRTDLAVVFIGINDVWWRKTTPEVFEQALRDLAASARASRSALVLATLTLRGELPDGRNEDDAKIEQFAEITRKVAGDSGVTLVDLRRAYVAFLQNHNAQLRVDGTLHFKPSGVLTYDGVHPSNRGVALLADLLSDGIYRALAGGGSTPEARAAQASADGPPARIDYSKHAFRPETWKTRGLSLQLVPWTGKEVVFLTTHEAFDPVLMKAWTERLDAGWRAYADLTGSRPAPFCEIEGRVTIAAVPGPDFTCGAACGYIGATGIELGLFYDRIYPALRIQPAAMPAHVFYEMGRNYYTFAERHSCFTTGFAVFMSHVCMDVLQCGDMEPQKRKTIEAAEQQFATSGLSFLDLFTTASGISEKTPRLKDAAGNVLQPSDQPVCYASAMLKLRRENGGEPWVKRFFRELASAPSFPPNTVDGALLQSWHWMLCASVAAQRDLSPLFVGEWRLPLAEETLAALAGIEWKRPGLGAAEVAARVTPRWQTGHAPSGSSRMEAPPPLIPEPALLTRQPGVLRVNAVNRIVVSDVKLEPLARVLSGEIHRTTGVLLEAGSGAHAPGDFVLQFSPDCKGEAYTLEVGDAVVARGGDYAALAGATATLVQLVRRAEGALEIPRVSISDAPTYAYRGALIDLARKYHTPGSIEQVIELCRFYKIRYLHLHLTDDQLFMFPSTKFPQLGASNREFARFEPASGPVAAPYTPAELRGLERFARERGVFLVPELDLPGHSGRLIADARETFGIPGNGSTVNIASPRALEAVSGLLEEVMDVFESTPYIHLGADEVGLGGLEKTAEFEEARKTFGVRNVHELYCKFITDLHAVVARRGKRAIVWEEAWNPGRAYPLPKDAVVMVWSQGRKPQDILKSGHAVINATWTPLYIVRENRKPLEFLFDWAPQHFGRENSNRYTTVPASPLLLGAQLCSWENSEAIEIQSMRRRLAVVAERTWNARAGGVFADFKNRLEPLDALLERLLHTVSVETRGTLSDGENTFREPLTLVLKPHREGLTLKYTLDNTLPNGGWQTYAGPITVEKSVHVRAGLFDAQGRQQGRLTGGWFRSEMPPKPNLATGKPVHVGPAPDRKDRWAARAAVDGLREDPAGHWASEGPAPQWLQVDLQTVTPIDFINVLTYWDGSRYYQGFAEVSVDGSTWTRVLDFSDNTIPATAAGMYGSFPRTDARFVRVHLLKNSANPFVHVVELVVERKGG